MCRGMELGFWEWAWVIRLRVAEMRAGLGCESRDEEKRTVDGRGRASYGERAVL